MPRATRIANTATLRIPPGYVVPAVYEGDPEVVAEVLTIGAALYDTVKRGSTDQTVQALEARTQQDIAALRHEASERIRVLETELDQTTTASRRTEETLHQTARDAREAHQAQLAAAQQEIHQTRQRMSEAQKQQEQRARAEEREATQREFDLRMRTLQDELAHQKEREAALLERKAVLEQGRDADIRIAEERTRALLQTTLDEKERAIVRMERAQATFTESLTKQTETIRILEETIRRKPSENAKIKGNTYEEIIREKLTAVYGLCDRFTLESKGNNGVGHEADFRMGLGEHKLLWETKHYGHAVPHEEVIKFLRDMKENPDVKIGVMLSRFTPIVGKTKTGDRTVEFFEGRMLIYLSRFEEMSHDTLSSLMLLFRFFWESERSIDDTESKQEAIRQIEKLHTASIQAKKEWRLHKSRNDETMRWMAEQVEDHETKLKQALNVLRGATLLEVPMGLFREFAGDEGAQRDVQLILEVTMPAPGESVTMNEVAEHVAKRKGVSKETAKAHIRGVLLDVSYEQLKGKPARILGLKSTKMSENIITEAVF